MKLFAEEPEVTDRLVQLGLTLVGLARVIASGGGGYATTTRFHPLSAPGSYLYHEATAALRRLLVPNGWVADESDGQPRTWDPIRHNSIIVQTGDVMTGIDGEHEPTTRHTKGTTTQKKIKTNASQLELFTIGQGMEPSSHGLFTWVLLVAVVEGQVRGELSLPARMSESLRPGGWLERILLPAIDLGAGPRTDVVTSNDGGPDTNFEVAWAK